MSQDNPSRKSPGLRAAQPPLALVSLALALVCACGPGDPGSPDGGRACQQDTDCNHGEQCSPQHLCVAKPCGGCLADQVCAPSGSCVPAQGAPCPSGGCPSGFTCNKNSVCAKPCLLNKDCGALVCNPATATCAQCIFDSDCAAVQGKSHCETNSGTCVACLTGTDCTSALGSGHYCDSATYSCQAGCRADGDCNLSASERCNGATATSAGRCVQCTKATEHADCLAAAPACDESSGRCVGCTADSYCGPGSPRCDTAKKGCVKCLPANDASGADCGYTPNVQTTPRDPHNASVCEPTSETCVTGCDTDAQCGCPIDPGTQMPTNCSRRHLQEHCDPALTSMPNAPGQVPALLSPTRGGCVECTSNAHCLCKVQGNQGLPECQGVAQAGAFNGSRCTKDSNGFGVCSAGCDTDSDCPSNKVCSLSGTTAHTCVECACPNGPAGSGPDAAWCLAPQTTGVVGGCASGKVCDVTTRLCRHKRQNEQCTASTECGDTNDPGVGQCIPGAQFCIRSSHAYQLNSPQLYCDSGKTLGRCGVACVDPQANSCTSSANCPSGTSCRQSTAVDTPPSGSGMGPYCVSNLCSAQ